VAEDNDAVRFSSAHRHIADEEEIELTSVGVDIGSSTSHLVFSRVLMERVGARYIVVYTESGYTARLVSKYRPNCLILGLSRHLAVCQRMKLLWGVRAKPVEQVRDLDELVEVIQAMMLELKWVKKGDLICIVAGTPVEVRGKTDLIKLHRIGEETHTS